MNNPIPVAALESLADALLDWKGALSADYEHARMERVRKGLVWSGAIPEVGAEPRLWCLHDRTVNLNDELDAWLIDLWQVRRPEHNLKMARTLQVLVCPTDVTPPTPLEGPITMSLAAPQSVDRRFDHPVWVPPLDLVAETGESVRFQCCIPDMEVAQRKKLRVDPVVWRMHMIVQVSSKPDIVAQLCLLALRQETAGDLVPLPEELSDLDEEVAHSPTKWLVDYLTAHSPRLTRADAIGAVNQAVTGYTVPRGPVLNYLIIVARGLARQGRPTFEVSEEAERYGLTPRTIYRAKKDGRDPAEIARKQNERRFNGLLARKVANAKGINLPAARRQVERMRKSGKDFEETARALLPELSDVSMEELINALATPD